MATKDHVCAGTATRLIIAAPGINKVIAFKGFHKIIAATGKDQISTGRCCNVIGTIICFYPVVATVSDDDVISSQAKNDISLFRTGKIVVSRRASYERHDRNPFFKRGLHDWRRSRSGSSRWELAARAK